jgi:hypothetical protein
VVFRGDFAVARSILFRSIFNGSSFPVFPYRGWRMSRNALNFEKQQKKFLAVIRVEILSY